MTHTMIVAGSMIWAGQIHIIVEYLKIVTADGWRNKHILRGCSPLTAMICTYIHTYLSRSGLNFGSCRLSLTLPERIKQHNIINNWYPFFVSRYISYSIPIIGGI